MMQTSGNYQSGMPAPININISYIDVTPEEFISSKQFVKSLALPYITDAYLKEKEHTLGLFIYTFRITYKVSAEQTMEWYIRRRVQDFQELEKAMKKDFLYHFKDKEIQKESEDHSPPKVLQELHRYLENLLKSPDIQFNTPAALLRFLEISNVNYGSSSKYKECFFRKQAGGRYGESKCARCGTLWGSWDKRYFVLTQDALMYSKGPNKENCQIREVLNIDFNFSVHHGKKVTGSDTHIIVRSSTRKLVIDTGDMFHYFDLLSWIDQAVKQSPYSNTHRFDSFSPIRQGFCQWYVDGEHYYEDLYKALSNAKSTIYITDWWLSPEFYLVRPVGQSDFKNRETRIDIVLKNAANRGVQVSIIHYQEPTLALNNDSLHTKTHLESLSPNIKVLRHPSQKIPFLWSHHEKMVVIDQQLGFMGGLDICYGRWDTNQHQLFDLVDQGDHELWPGIDYANMKQKDLTNVKAHQLCSLGNKQEKPRMPWHDIAMQVIGEPVIDMSRHFIQFWNFVLIDMDFKKRTQQQMMSAPTKIQKVGSFLDNLKTKHDQNKQNELKYSSIIEDEEEKNEGGVMGKQFEKGHFNIFMKQLESEIESNPSEEQDKVQVDYLQPNEIELYKSRAGIFQSQRTQTDKKKEAVNRRLSVAIGGSNEEQQTRPLDKAYVDMMKNLMSKKDEEAYYINKKQQTEETNQQDDEQGNGEVHMIQQIQPTVRSTGSQVCQMLRSASTWSIGTKQVNREMSIQLAYIQLIGEAKQFIYIENQFFISATASSPVENLIASSLIKRIRQAHEHNQRFKVVVFIPLLPGFEGEIDDPAAAVMKVQLHWEYFTISRGGTSILEQLKDIDNLNDYIEFYSLRSHGKNIKNQPQTEILYIHSKLMIVDDEIVLMGSANINDRSLMGTRDSEIAMVVEDNIKEQCRFNDKPAKKSKFAHTLRKHLYIEHFGLPQEDVIDPLSDDLQLKMRDIALTNTQIFRSVFACYPDDNVLSLAELDKFKKTRDIDKYHELAEKIRGHAVQFPLQFLKNENLKIGIFQKEYLCPEINFT